MMSDDDDDDDDDAGGGGGGDDISLPWSKTKRKNSKPWSLKHCFTDISAKTIHLSVEKKIKKRCHLCPAKKLAD